MRTSGLICALLPAVLLGCSDGASENGSTDDASINAAVLSEEPLEIADAQSAPCVWGDSEIGMMALKREPTAVEARPMDKRCFYTINGGVVDDASQMVLVTLIFDGYPAAEYEGFTGLFEETPLEGFDAPVNRSPLHKEGEEHAYVAYPAQGSVMVVVKSRDIDDDQLDALARGLVENLIIRLS